MRRWSGGRIGLGRAVDILLAVVCCGHGGQAGYTLTVCCKGVGGFKWWRKGYLAMLADARH